MNPPCKSPSSFKVALVLIFSRLLPTIDFLFLDALRPGDLIRFGRCSRATYDCVQAYLRRTFTVDRVLSQFFPPGHTSLFRRVMADTDMIVTRKAALAFFSNPCPPLNVLDVCITRDSFFGLLDFLSETSYTPMRCDDLESIKSLIRQFLHVINHETGEEDSFVEQLIYFNSGHKKIVVEVRETTSIASIFDSHSSKPFGSSLALDTDRVIACHMNFITSDFAVCLYPAATLDHKVTVDVCVCGPPCHCQEIDDMCPAFEKIPKSFAPNSLCVRYGVSLQTHPAYAPNVVIITRSVGDAFCWKIPLPPLLDHPPTSTFPQFKFDLVLTTIDASHADDVASMMLYTDRFGCPTVAEAQRWDVKTDAHLRSLSNSATCAL